jgi:ABC-type multidrug transport system fused ATPase/permease subunit
VPPERNGRVDEAARQAYADEFIRNIPGGYEARLGERGNTLSGGQRQRLAIARAVYRDAPILIFDEATSQIDSESELKIQTALREFAQGRTTIIIAHRLSTIQYASRIIVMDAGRIIDQGAHAELFARCALYRTLCETQLTSEPRAEATSEQKQHSKDEVDRE